MAGTAMSNHPSCSQGQTDIISSFFLPIVGEPAVSAVLSSAIQADSTMPSARATTTHHERATMHVTRLPTIAIVDGRPTLISINAKTH
jgi:hypothetical protein